MTHLSFPESSNQIKKLSKYKEYIFLAMLTPAAILRQRRIQMTVVLEATVYTKL